MPEPCSPTAAPSGTSCGVRVSECVRVRNVVLNRTVMRGAGGGVGGGAFGLSVRGGREHGTGFFVSHVEPASEAQRRGVLVGDQIVRVNGLRVEEATHHELLQLVGQHARLALTLRSVGMIPVKNEKQDVTWQVVSRPNTEHTRGDTCQEVQIILNVPQGAKLGCGVCRGPEWRPGVFVQFTKEGGLARSAGLRAGDQLLQCNGVHFSEDFPFSEAVALLKSSSQLVLLVRPGAGADLFPSESSGYNSSASSIAGDVSPAPALKHRLSVVNETPEDWSSVEFGHSLDDAKVHRHSSSSTVIHVGSESNIQENQDSHLAQVCLMQQQQETTTVLVEVHRADDIPQSSVPCPPPPQSPLMPTSELHKSESTNSISSLSSALSQEIERRRNQRQESNGVKQEGVQRRLKLQSVDDEKRHQHEQLMQEFKRAHRKMFANTTDLADLACSHGHKFHTEERNAPVCQTVNNRCSVEDRVDSIRNGQNSSCQKQLQSDSSDSLTWSSKRSSLDNSLSSASSVASYGQPPPCPTPDYDTSSIHSSLSSSSLVDTAKCHKQNHTMNNGKSLSNSVITGISTSPVQNMVKKGNSVMVKNNNKNNAIMTQSGKSLNGVSSETVEMESLESFELTNPSNPAPKPPETYFPKRRQQSSTTSSPKSSLSASSNNTMTRKPRPVSVTIGAYPSGTTRREPCKFSFLNNIDEPDRGGPVSDRLRSELAQTLNRSDLRQRTEQENSTRGLSCNTTITNGSSINGPSSAKGTVTVFVNNTSKTTPPPPPPCLFSSGSNTILSSATPGIRSVAEKLNETLNGPPSVGNKVTIHLGTEQAEQQ